ncbi:BnaC05g29440D [Brassica napus]|uniref:BnaC05g29440D protein n=1 Tax=Brassica napus TaxID=3708 RepID=A0A078F738_BRANA|nr:BnaC05g29440D [Brassica napus]
MRCLMVEEANHLQNNLAAEKIRRGGDLRVEAEERRTNLRLREEQDAAYRASLEADQARESQRQEEEERLEREAAEADRKRK